MKVALIDAPAMTFAALRSMLSAGAMFVLLLLLRRRLKPVRGWSLVLLGLLQTMGFVGFTALALKTGAAGKSAVLAYTMPFWTLLLAGPLLGEHMRRAQLPAVALAAVGLAGILTPWSGTLNLAASLCALGAAVSWAGSNIVAKRMQLKSNELVNVAAWQMFFGGIGVSVLALAFDAEPINWNVGFSIALAYNVVFATALAWWLWLYALNRLTTGATGIASLGTPVLALVIAWIQLGEIPTVAEGIGMALIVAALGWLSIVGWRRLTPRAIGA